MVIEREIAMETNECLDAMINMICSYYVFDINYPKQLYPVLLFVQRFIVGIKDDQPIPTVLTRVLAGLDQHLD